MMTKNIKRDKKGNGWSAIGLAMIVLLIIAIAGTCCFNAIVRNNDYNENIHCHIVNARYSQDPAVIKSELLLAEQGMRDAGLTNDTSCRFFPWSQTPDNSMQQQYLQLDQAIDMCDKLQAMDLNSTSYGSTLTNLQNYIYDDNGWADETAQGAFNLNTYAFSTIYMWVIIVIMALILIVAMIKLD